MSFWHDMDIKPCISRNTCEFVDSGICTYACYQYHSMNSLEQTARIPKRYRGFMQLQAPKEDLEVFKTLSKFQNNVREHVEKGHGLYLVSETKGNGKTSWAIKILQTYLEEVANETDLLVCRALYVNVPQYMKRLKDNIDTYDEELHVLKEEIESADLVVWDDLGREKPSDYSREILYSNINYRYEENKSQIFTSNKTLDTLASPKQLGQETVDRISGQCMPLTFAGKGRRQETAWWNIK